MIRPLWLASCLVFGEEWRVADDAVAPGPVHTQAGVSPGPLQLHPVPRPVCPSTRGSWSQASELWTKKYKIDIFSYKWLKSVYIMFLIPKREASLLMTWRPAPPGPPAPCPAAPAAPPTPAWAPGTRSSLSHCRARGPRAWLSETQSSVWIHHWSRPRPGTGRMRSGTPPTRRHWGAGPGEEGRQQWPLGRGEYFEKNNHFEQNIAQLLDQLLNFSFLHLSEILTPACRGGVLGHEFLLKLIFWYFSCVREFVSELMSRDFHKTCLWSWIKSQQEE